VAFTRSFVAFAWFLVLAFVGVVVLVELYLYVSISVGFRMVHSRGFCLHFLALVDGSL
jgi:hypothetical protein